MWFTYSFYDLVVSVEYIYEKIGKNFFIVTSKKQCIAIHFWVKKR